MNPLNIALICPNPDDVTSFYRGYGPLGHIHRNYSSVRVFNIDTKHRFDWSMFSHIDVAFIQRPSGAHWAERIARLKEFGVKVVLDYDDDYFSIPNCNKMFPIANSEGFKEYTQECIKLADAVMVSTPELIKEFRKFASSQNYILVPNAVDMRYWDDYVEVTHQERKDRVVWRGGDSHSKDVLTVANDIINLASAHPKWDFLFCGWNPWFLTERLPKGKFAYYNGPITSFQKELKDSRSRVGFVPLENITFNRCKSNIAWLEYSMAGILTVASNLPEFQRPGCLVTRNSRDMATFIKGAMEMGDQERINTLRKSQEYIIENLTLDVVNKVRVETLRGL